MIPLHLIQNSGFPSFDINHQSIISGFIEAPKTFQMPGRRRVAVFWALVAGITCCTALKLWIGRQSRPVDVNVEYMENRGERQAQENMRYMGSHNGQSGGHVRRSRPVSLLTSHSSHYSY
jgi:hypothetical protein